MQTKTPMTTRSAADISETDPVTAYALAVLDGSIVAGPYVRGSCKRHIDDLINGWKRGLVWDVRAALHAITFFPDCLTVEEDNEIVPFYLLDYQIFVVGSIFGWKRRNGFRRFTSAYVEGGKGCGKSPLAAGIGLLMLMADKELSAQVYSVGAKKDQSRILFDDAVQIVNNSPQLRKRLQKTGKSIVNSLVYRPTNGVFKPLSSDEKKSGLRVYCALVDELHEHKTRYSIDQMKGGFKGRRQPLVFVITNSGFDKQSICYEWHEDAVGVAEGTRVNDRLFSYVMALDLTDDPFEPPIANPCWVKTNPGLGVTVQEDYLEAQVHDAITIPGRENFVRRLNFCEWTDSDVAWMTRATWMATEEELVRYITPKEDRLNGGFVDLEPFRGAKCCIGLDLAFSFDLATLSYAFPEGDNLLCFTEYFTPIDTAAEREKNDRVPYTTWINNGLIHGCPGKVIRRSHIGARLAYIKTVLDIEYAAFDRYAHKDLDQDMADQGIVMPWIEHPQGFRRGGFLPFPQYRNEKGDKLENPLYMPESVRQFETRILDGTIRNHPSPVTRWQVSSVIIRDDPAGTGNRVFDKAKSSGRIDGIVSEAMAVGAADMRLPKMNLKGFLNNPVIVSPT